MSEADTFEPIGASAQRVVTRLDVWREEIAFNLRFIEIGANMAARRAAKLPGRPVWETLAEHELSSARTALETALADITAAQAAYSSKEIVA